MALSKNSQRTIAVGIFGALIVLMLLLIIVPVQLTHVNYDDQMDKKMRQLQQYSKILSEKDNLKQQLAHLKHEISNNKAVFISKNESIAFAQLNDYVTRIVKKNRANLLSIRMQSPKNNRQSMPYHQISVVIDMKSKIVSLQKILYQLEKSHPLLTIDNLKISTQVNQAKQTPLLLVRFDVNTFWKMTETTN